MSQALLQMQTSSPPPLAGTAFASGVYNPALAALATQNAGTTVPTSGSTGLVSVGGLFWHDLTTGNLYVRDQADTTWIATGNINETTKVFLPANPFALSLKSVSGVYEVQPTDTGLLVNAASGSATIVLQPTLAGFVNIKRIDDVLANSVTISGTVDAQSNLYIPGQNQFFVLWADPSDNWWIFGRG